MCSIVAPPSVAQMGSVSLEERVGDLVKFMCLARGVPWEMGSWGKFGWVGSELPLLYLVLGWRQQDYADIPWAGFSAYFLLYAL